MIAIQICALNFQGLQKLHLFSNLLLFLGQSFFSNCLTKLVCAKVCKNLHCLATCESQATRKRLAAKHKICSICLLLHLLSQFCCPFAAVDDRLSLLKLEELNADVHIDATMCVISTLWLPSLNFKDTIITQNIVPPFV